MAKILSKDIQSSNVSSYFPLMQIIIVGMILGLLFWAFNVFIGRYVSSPEMSGNISTVIVATIGLAVMAAMRAARPIIIVIASAVTLWGLATWTSGLSLGEVIAWDVLLYSLAYVVFSWVSRYLKIVPVLIFAIIIVAIARLATFF